MTAISDVPQPPVKRFARLGKYAPFLLMGPVSGPLAAAMIHHFRQGKPVRAGLYGAALVAFTLLLPYVTAKLGLRLL